MIFPGYVASPKFLHSLLFLINASSKLRGILDSKPFGFGEISRSSLFKSLLKIHVVQYSFRMDPLMVLLWVDWLCASVDKNLASQEALQLLYLLSLSIQMKTKDFTLSSCWCFLTYAKLPDFVLFNSYHHTTTLTSLQSNGGPRCSLSCGNLRWGSSNS